MTMYRSVLQSFTFMMQNFFVTEFWKWMELPSLDGDVIYNVQHLITFLNALHDAIMEDASSAGDGTGLWRH